MRKALDSNNVVTYNKNTGEYTIALDKLPNTGKWDVITTDGRVVVDPKVERKIEILSRVLSSICGKPKGFNTIPVEEIYKKSIQPMIADLIESGLLHMRYGNKYLLNNPQSNEVGFSASIGFGAHMSGSVSIATDRYGNIGITGSLGAGAGTPSNSVGLFSTRTTAHTVNNLAGISMGVGGSVGENVSVGADVIVFSDSTTGEVYYGLQKSIGVAPLNLIPVPFEIHANISNTSVRCLNIWKDLAIGGDLSNE